MRDDPFAALPLHAAPLSLPPEGSAMRASFAGRARDSLQIFQAGIAAVQADALLDETDWQAELPRPLAEYDKIVVAGMGKASMAMLAALRQRLGRRMYAGRAVAPYGYKNRTGAIASDALSPPCRVMEAGHPLPDKRSEQAARILLDAVSGLGPNDLAIVPASGGGSALCALFPPGISMEDAREAFRRLLVAGADIHAINKVRRRISQTGGGGLARAAAPADVLTLCLSDVPGDDAEHMYVIGGGPTLPDPYTAQDALDVLKRYGDQVPESVWRYVEGLAGGPEQPAGEPGRVRAVLLGNVRTALEAAAKEARTLGYRARIVTDALSGEARDVGAAMARRLLKEPPGSCLLWGGETSVTVRGDGLGGRNQELSLAAALRMAGAAKDISLMSAGTDGRDGPVDAAGAIATPDTAVEARRQGLDPSSFLARNDSYGFWKRTPGLLQTGPTHTNVMDMQIALS